MKYQAPSPIRRWSSRDRLVVVLALTVATAAAGFVFIADLSTTPAKWVIGSLTFVTAPIVFIAFLEFFSDWYEKSSGWRESIFEISAFALFVGSNFAIFILLSWLWRSLGALDYGALWTTGSVVLRLLVSLQAENVTV